MIVFHHYFAFVFPFLPLIALCSLAFYCALLSRRVDCLAAKVGYKVNVWNGRVVPVSWVGHK